MIMLSARSQMIALSLFAILGGQSFGCGSGPAGFDAGMEPVTDANPDERQPAPYDATLDTAGAKQGDADNDLSSAPITSTQVIGTVTGDAIAAKDAIFFSDTTFVGNHPGDYVLVLDFSGFCADCKCMSNRRMRRRSPSTFR